MRLTWRDSSWLCPALGPSGPRSDCPRLPAGAPLSQPLLWSLCDADPRGGRDKRRLAQLFRGQRTTSPSLPTTVAIYSSKTATEGGARKKVGGCGAHFRPTAMIALRGHPSRARYLAWLTSKDWGPDPDRTVTEAIQAPPNCATAHFIARTNYRKFMVDGPPALRSPPEPGEGGTCLSHEE